MAALSPQVKYSAEDIDCPIVSVAPHLLQSGHYDAKDFLCYFYYGGMIYTALKNYNRALYFFEMVSLYSNW